MFQDSVVIVYMRFRDVWLWWVCASCGGCGQLCGESVAVDDFNVIVGVQDWRVLCVFD